MIDHNLYLLSDKQQLVVSMLLNRKQGPDWGRKVGNNFIEIHPDQIKLDGKYIRVADKLNLLVDPVYEMFIHGRPIQGARLYRDRIVLFTHADPKIDKNPIKDDLIYPEIPEETKLDINMGGGKMIRDIAILYDVKWGKPILDEWTSIYVMGEKHKMPSWMKNITWPDDYDYMPIPHMALKLDKVNKKLIIKGICEIPLTDDKIKQIRGKFMRSYFRENALHLRVEYEYTKVAVVNGKVYDENGLVGDYSPDIINKAYIIVTNDEKVYKTLAKSCDGVFLLTIDNGFIYNRNVRPEMKSIEKYQFNNDKETGIGLCKARFTPVVS